MNEYHFHQLHIASFCRNLAVCWDICYHLIEVMALIAAIIDSVRRSPTGENVVILGEKRGKRYLPVFIGDAESDAIIAALANIDARRPVGFDLFYLIIDVLSVKVSSAIIHSVSTSGDTMSFRTKVILSADAQSMEIECDASDAIALAVITQTQIFVDDSVMEVAGVEGDITPALKTNELSVKTAASDFSEGLKAKPEEVPVLRRLSTLEIEQGAEEVEMQVASISTAFMGYQNLIALKDKREDWTLIIWMAWQAAERLSRIFHNIGSYGPYHMIYKIIKCFGYSVKKAVLSDIREHIILARIILEFQNKQLGVQCCPSDAIAVALVARAPILATKSVLHQVGTSSAQRRRIKEIEALVDVINATPWKLWINKKKKAQAYNILTTTAMSDNDPKIREAASEVLKRFQEPISSRD